MPPNLEDQNPEATNLEPIDENNIRLTLTPLLQFSSTSSSPNTSEAASLYSEASRRQTPTQYLQEMALDVLNDNRNLIPMEHNLKELLLRVTDTEELHTVTQIKLRVIAREVSLQQMGYYLPALRELVLDGSIVSSLRDLGSGLKNLKILKVNKCQLSCIDGVFGFEDLEELYIAENEIKDVSPCAFLSNLKVLDIRRNQISHITSLGFIGLCESLEHLFVEGNAHITDIPRYRQAIKTLLPGLKSLDGQEYSLDEMMQTILDTEVYLARNSDIFSDDLGGIVGPDTSFNPAVSRSDLHRNRVTSAHSPDGFIVRFPPRVFPERTNMENGDTTFGQASK